MEVTADTPRKPRTIAGVLIKVPAPILATTAMTEQFAAMLNQTIAENFSNNLRDRIGKFVPPAPEGSPYSETNPAPAPRVATVEEAQAIVDAYAVEYQPGVRTSGGGGGRVSLSPVEREMRNIAQEKLNALLGEQNIKRSQLPKEGEGSYSALVDQIVKDHTDTLRAQADKIVAAREKASKGTDLDLGSLQVKPATPPATPPAS